MLRVLRWMGGLRSPRSVALPRTPHRTHGQERGRVGHGGELARLGALDRTEAFALAREQALRITSRLEREGKSTCWTFRPGRHDPTTAATTSSTAARPAMGWWRLWRRSRGMSPGERDLISRAAVLHAQTYLRYAAFDKGIAAQRAWALTGVAQAWRESGHGVLEYATVEGVKDILAGMRSDGSFPYHPLHANPGHPGASDASAFYQGRITAFLIFALQAVRRDAAQARWKDGLHQSLLFLAALYGPDGTKVASVEAKPWYHGAEYEVASHPFDVYALARGARLFGDRQLAATAWKAWQAWARHVDEHGRPQSHLPGPGRRASYQCAVFWAGHASWAARALEDLQWIVDQGLHRAPAAAPRVRVFADAGLARLENADGVAWVRGAAPPANGLHGSPRAGGLLQWTLAAGGAQLSRRRFCQHDELEWTLRTGRILRLGAGRRAAAGDWRFSLWLLRNTRRRSGLLAGLREPLRFARRGCGISRSRWRAAPGTTARV
ncbi:MAG: hypothetical protein R3E96_13640 [Planctomycetota bacterium]